MGGWDGPDKAQVKTLREMAMPLYFSLYTSARKGCWSMRVP